MVRAMIKKSVELTYDKVHEQWLFLEDELVITRYGETHIIDLSEMQEKTTVYYSLRYCPDENIFSQKKAESIRG